MRQTAGPYFKKRILPVLICVLIGFCFTPSTAAFAGDYPVAKSDNPQNAKIENPYMRVNFSDLFDDEALSLSEGMDNTKITEMTETNSKTKETKAVGAKVRGTVADLTSGRVVIGKDFDFDGNPVGRISLLAGTDMGLIVKARVYLDDETEPAAVFRLDNGKSSSNWDEIDEYTSNVYDKKITGTHTISVGFDVVGEDDANKKINVALKRIEFVEDSGIPTLYFNIDESEATIEEMNNSEGHKVRCTGGSFDIQVPEGYVNEYGGTFTSEKDIKLSYIRGRGHTTWDDITEKKPYKFKMETAKDLFNMGSNAHYVLLANRFDNSLIRDRITTWLGLKLGMPYTPECIPVDMVMNGDYLGSYLLSEEVRVGDARVDVDKLKKDDTELPKISGGYLLRMEPYGEDSDPDVFVTKNGVRFQNDTPDFIDYQNDAQKEYIRGFVQKVEDAILGEDFKDSEGTSYRKYMDLDSLVDFWWMQEFPINRDGYKTSSNYLYKTRDTAEKDGKLFWGPIWDFDLVAWGDEETPDDMDIDGLTNTGFKWIDRLIEDPVFAAKLRARWNDLNDLITEVIKDGGVIDQYYDQLLISERYDVEKLGFKSGFSKDIPADYTYKDEMDFLKKWIKERQAWVNEHIYRSDSLIQEVTFYVGGKVFAKKSVKGKIDVSCAGIPPEKEGYVFDAWYTKPEGGERIATNSYDPYEVNKNTSLYGRCVKKENAKMAKDLFIYNKEEWVDISEDEYGIVYMVYPMGMPIRYIRWSSSDESIAEVDYYGNVQMHKTGDVTITGTLPGGNRSSIILHIYDPDETQAVDLEGIKVEKDVMTIETGQYKQNPITRLPTDKPLKGTMIHVSSDDYNVAEFNYAGVVTGVKPGTATMTVKDDITGISVSFKVIVKNPNPVTVKAKTAKVKYAKVKKKAVKVKRSNAITVKNAKGTVTYAQIAKGSSKRLSINKKTGIITVKKGTKKGLYKMKVKVKDAGNAKYMPKTRTVTVKVRVR